MTTGDETRAERFAALHRRGDPFLLPNAWDVASALLLAGAGFPAVGTTSLGVTAAAGLVDSDGTGRTATVALARQVAARLTVPVTVDCEGGYSDDPATVAALASELAASGVAGINLEDSVPGGQLRPAAEQVRIIRAVTAAVPGLFVNARTDTYWLRWGREEDRFADTIGRLSAYADAGAAGVFVPALTDPGAIESVTSRIALPLNLLWRPGTTLAELGRLGVARVSTGSGPYRRALAAGLATAVAARDGTNPPDAELPYGDVIGLLRGTGS
jgi:2-methylisocitrate lyase-like PEP mutase family enzyme